MQEVGGAGGVKQSAENADGENHAVSDGEHVVNANIYQVFRAARDHASKTHTLTFLIALLWIAPFHLTFEDIQVRKS